MYNYAIASNKATIAMSLLFFRRVRALALRDPGSHKYLRELGLGWSGVAEFEHYADERLIESGEVESTALYADYVAWCAENGARPESRKVVSSTLYAMGFTRRKTSTARYWVGISLR